MCGMTEEADQLQSDSGLGVLFSRLNVEQELLNDLECGEERGDTGQLGDASLPKLNVNDCDDDCGDDSGDDSDDDSDYDSELVPIPYTYCPSEDDDHASEQYASKGPVHQRRILSPSQRIVPYHGPDSKADSDDHKEREVGALLKVFKEEPETNLTGCRRTGQGEFVNIQRFLKHRFCRFKASENNNASKNGIPKLPDTGMNVSIETPALMMKTKSGDLMVLPGSLPIVLDYVDQKIGFLISKQKVPKDADVGEDSVDVYVLLNQEFSRVVYYKAVVVRGGGQDEDVGRRSDSRGGGELTLLAEQVVQVVPFLSSTGRSGTQELLEGVTEAQLEDSMRLVNSKNVTDLLKTYGPNRDTMLMTFCCKREEPPTIRAQIFALVKRILSLKEMELRGNVVQRNGCGLSSLDYTTVTNNRRIALFLVDLYFVMGENIYSPDESDNTMLHMMARKGEDSAPTLQALLNLRLASDVKHKVYNSVIRNKKHYLPIHHAVMGKWCPQTVIQTLQQDMPDCMVQRTCDGSTPLHLACQFSSDPKMVATLLHYNRDVVNFTRNDGFTPLHLVAARNDANDLEIGLVPLDEGVQNAMIRLLLDHGADESVKVEDKYTPFDLVKVGRECAKLLLKSGTVTAEDRGNVPSAAPLATSSTHPDPSDDRKSSANGFMSPASLPRTLNNPVLRGNDPFICGAAVGEASSSTGSATAVSAVGTEAVGSYREGSHERSITSSPPQRNGGIVTSSGNVGYPRWHYPVPQITSSRSVQSDGMSDSGGWFSDASDISNNPEEGVVGEGLFDNEIDLIARALYSHPTIQAVIQEAECNDHTDES